MQCPRCQHENPQGARFCEECATVLARVCSSCGTTLSATAKFCHACAHPVATGAGTPARSPDSYTPKHLAEKILTSKSALEGERKQVTVLFADLKGSMELLADRDPEEARKILDPVLERMMEAVHRYEGTVNQVMGDGIMALFGAPLAHEDHAVRACYAALRMHEAVARYADELRLTQGLDVQIRVGLNSGEVVVRSIGGDLHMDYTAVGQTTHLAARMEQLARPGTTLVTADTLALAEGYIEVKPLGPVPVKGVAEPVAIHEMTGAGAVRTRLQAAAARGFTRFVGREGEVEQLGKALERARAGSGQLVAVVGEPGVGKSRLFHEFTRSHRTRDWLILEASSVSYGKATSYLPVIDLLKSYFKIHDRDRHRDIREKVTGKLLTLDRALESTLSALLALLDVPVEDPQWQALDPPQHRQRMLDAVKRLLLRESQVQPLLAVFEDLHWIDSETQALLESLIESLPTARLLLLVNYRPEYQHGWGSKTYYSQLRLDALPPESADELLHTLMGTDPTVEPLKAVLIARTGGNPLFLEESVRTLVETNALVGERGKYRLEQAVDTIRVPVTVQAILAARIDRLPPEDKQLLQTAAVIGQDVAFVLLQAVAEQSDEMLRRGLAHLQSAEFLYETSLFPDLEYTFKHALTHDVAYGSLLQGLRCTLHVRIADAIERLYGERLAEHVERLAHHAFKGEAWERAVTYLRQAGVRALARSAHQEALSCFEQVLVALQHLPETAETQRQAIDTRFDLRNSLLPLDEFGKMFDHLQEAERLATRLGDRRRLAWAWAYMAFHHGVTGNSREACTVGQRAHAIAKTLGDPRLQVIASFQFGVACHRSGDYRQAAATWRESLPLLEGSLGRERFGLAAIPSAASRFQMARNLAELGEFDQCFAHGEDGLRIAEAMNHSFTLVLACAALGNCHLVRGNVAAATRLLERGLALSRERNVTRPDLATALGYAHVLSARVAEGMALLDHVHRGIDSMSAGRRLDVTVTMGEAYLRAHRLDDASAAAGRALTDARASGQRGTEASALRLLGEIASHRDPPDPETAEDDLRQALQLAAELGMRPLVAHCHLGLGKLYQRTGKREQAQEHLITATTMYREMGMTYWLEKAEAELVRASG